MSLMPWPPTARAEEQGQSQCAYPSHDQAMVWSEEVPRVGLANPELGRPADNGGLHRPDGDGQYLLGSFTLGWAAAASPGLRVVVLLTGDPPGGPADPPG